MKIYINPGHGGSDSGAVALNRKEKYDNLKYATAVANLLESAGHTIKLERSNDTFISVTDIAQKANAWGADLFVSFHRNAGGGTGAECLIVSSASQTSKKLAAAIQKELVGVGFKDRGVKVQDKNTYVLKATKMPAATIECGFIDSVSDNALFDSKFDEICNSITSGILSVAGGQIANEPIKDNGAYAWKAGLDAYPIVESPHDGAKLIAYISPNHEITLDSYFSGDKYARVKFELNGKSITGYIRFDFISKK